MEVTWGDHTSKSSHEGISIKPSCFVSYQSPWSCICSLCLPCWNMSPVRTGTVRMVFRGVTWVLGTAPGQEGAQSSSTHTGVPESQSYSSEDTLLVNGRAGLEPVTVWRPSPQSQAFTPGTNIYKASILCQVSGHTCGIKDTIPAFQKLEDKIRHVYGTE